MSFREKVPGGQSGNAFAPMFLRCGDTDLTAVADVILSHAPASHLIRMNRAQTKTVRKEIFPQSMFGTHLLAHRIQPGYITR